MFNSTPIESIKLKLRVITITSYFIIKDSFIDFLNNRILNNRNYSKWRKINRNRESKIRHYILVLENM